jgi:hypothetical protein
MLCDGVVLARITVIGGSVDIEIRQMPLRAVAGSVAALPMHVTRGIGEQARAARSPGGVSKDQGDMKLHQSTAQFSPSDHRVQ